MRTLSQFEEIWIVDFEYRCPNGGLPSVHCMVAREIKTDRLIGVSSEELSSVKEAPFDTGPQSLFVAF